MTEVYSCKFNIDTGCVEMECVDGRFIAIDCTAVEDEIADNRFDRAELDYLIYNQPVEYVNLILNTKHIKHYRTDISTLSQVGTKLNTAEELSQNADDRRTQIYRYIRLTNLIHELLDMVDVGRIAFTPAVELSYLTENEQRDLLTTIESEECTPSLAQTQQMRKLSENNELDIDRILSIMTKPKANQKEYLKIPTERINQYFDERFTNKQREEIIIKALDHYSRYLQRTKDRGVR